MKACDSAPINDPNPASHFKNVLGPQANQTVDHPIASVIIGGLIYGGLEGGEARDVH